MKVLGIVLPLLIVCGYGCLSPSDSQETPAQPLLLGRLVLVLEDITGSYPFQQEARSKMLEIVNALGPGDEFLFIQIQQITNRAKCLL